MSDDLQLTREEDVLVFTYGLLGEMKEAGLVEGGAHRLTGRGLERFHRLRSEGFELTKEDVAWAMDAIQAFCTQPDVDEAA